MNILTHSPEHIPWAKYRKIELIFSLPFAIAIWMYLEVIWFMTRRKSKLVNPDHIPKDAIIYGFHYDMLPNYVSTTLISRSGRKIRWIGFHGFLSYLGFVVGSLPSTRYVRFSFSKAHPPIVQLKEVMENEPDSIFGIFTDAGGPYGRVRESLVKLSLETNRPLVPFHSNVQPKLVANKHTFPFPWGSTHVSFGKTIEPSTLKKLELEGARKLLQQELEAIQSDPSLFS